MDFLYDQQLNIISSNNKTIVDNTGGLIFDC